MEVKPFYYEYEPMELAMLFLKEREQFMLTLEYGTEKSVSYEEGNKIDFKQEYTEEQLEYLKGAQMFFDSVYVRRAKFRDKLTNSGPKMFSLKKEFGPQFKEFAKTMQEHKILESVLVLLNNYEHCFRDLVLEVLNKIEHSNYGPSDWKEELKLYMEEFDRSNKQDD